MQKKALNFFLHLIYYGTKKPEIYKIAEQSLQCALKPLSPISLQTPRCRKKAACRRCLQKWHDPPKKLRIVHLI